MKTQTKRFLSAGFLGALALTALTGCGRDGRSRNLMNDIVSQQYTGSTDTNFSSAAGNTADGADDSITAPGTMNPSRSASGLPTADAVTCTDFAVRMLQECLASDKMQEEIQKPPYSETPQEAANTLISPLSVINALAMTAGGARGETLTQMEALFGADLSSLCDYLCAYNNRLPSGEKYKLHLANSIWVKNTPNLNVSPDFLTANADHFKADIYTAPFDDSTTKEINNWVSENTDKMIPDILDRIPEDAVMYLINALAFDAEWQTVYQDDQVRDGVFTCESGAVKDVEMMYSQEHAYLRDTDAQGFLKYYGDGKYAFAALLPEEGVSLDDYIASLTGRGLHELLTNCERTPVQTAMPKFETTYDTLLNPVLEGLGMTDAFDSDVADLSGLGSSPAGNLYISRVLHKTYIAVDEKGTKAGAATAVEIKEEGAMLEPEEVKTVYLDRPFLYMIVDCEENFPVFIGTVNDPTR